MSELYRQKPQINSSCPSIGRMWLICGCAFFCILQSAVSDGGQSLAIAVTALLTAILLELFLMRRHNGVSRIKDGSAAATALILTIMLPNQIHPAYAALGVAFAIVVVKYSFGGLGSNWLNPALGGWLFIRLSWPAAFSGSLAGSQLEGSSSPVTEFIASNASAIDNSVNNFFNNSIFSLSGSQLPSGYIDLLFSNNPGIITDRGLFFLIAGTVIITAFGINRGWVPLVFLSVYGFLIRFAGANGDLFSGDVLYGFLSGGTIMAAFILAAEPSSGAKLQYGVLFTVIFGAVLSWFFRYRCMEYTGCFIALAFVNCLTPIVRLIEDKFFLSGLQEKNIPNPGLDASGRTEVHDAVRENSL